MLENLPSLHSPVSSWRMGKFRARGYTYSLPEEKIEKKKRKTKQGKHESNLRKFVEFPAISILFYRVVLTEWLLHVIIFVSEKYERKFSLSRLQEQIF